MAEFKSFVINNNAFGNVFCYSQKSFHTFLRCSGKTRNFNYFVNQYSIVELEQWSISLYFLGRTFSQRCENTFWITEYITKSFVINEVNYKRLELTQCIWHSVGMERHTCTIVHVCKISFQVDNSSFLYEMITFCWSTLF